MLHSCGGFNLPSGAVFQCSHIFKPFAVLFRSVSHVHHSVVILRSWQAVCSVLTVFLNSSLCVISLVLRLPWMPLFSSPDRELEVYYSMHFLDWYVWDQMAGESGKKKQVTFAHPLGITVLPVGEEVSLH